MSNDTITALVNRLRENPRSTAQELGTTTQVMDELAAAGHVTRFGNRVTGKRGRPPVEWVVAGTDVSDTQQEAVAEAEARIELHAHYWRVCNRMWRLRDAHPALLTSGDNVPDEVVEEYMRLMDEKAAIYEGTGGTAPEVRENDYTITGNAVAVEVETDNVLVAA
jgi:hypothetical protein